MFVIALVSSLVVDHCTRTRFSYYYSYMHLLLMYLGIIHLQNSNTARKLGTHFNLGSVLLSELSTCTC